MVPMLQNPLLLFGMSLVMAVTAASFSTPCVVPDRKDFLAWKTNVRPRNRYTRKPIWGLFQSATASSDSDFSDTVDEPPGKEELAMPWTDFQEWALRDNLPRYIVSIPRNSEQTPEQFALWRTMAREVTELSGYPIEFLQDMHARQSKESDAEKAIPVSLGVLPLLDEFDFESSGGVSGMVYGIPGVADGTKISTPSVSDVHITVPQGYVRTEDGSVAYELGTPLRDFYSLDGTSGTAARLSGSVQKAASNVSNLSASVGSPVEDPDTMLVRLGVSTGILLGGALAVNMLSHHLTVNVFWV